MSPNNKRKPKPGLRLLQTLFSATLSLPCAPCGTRSLQHDVVYHPLPAPGPTHMDALSPTFSLNLHPHTSDIASSVLRTPRRSSAASSKLEESVVAVLKESRDPYLDFRHSMLQMIFEKEMFSYEDLQELLACFLRLNSPRHHDDVIRAFSEIWASLMSPPIPGNCLN